MTTKNRHQFISNTCAVLNIFKIPACLVDNSGTILGLNDQMKKEYNINSDINQSLNIHDYIHIEQKIFENVDRENQTVQYINENLTINITSQLFGDESFFVLNILHQVPELLWKRENVQASFMQAADHINEGIFLADIDGKIVFVNCELSRRVNKPIQELMGIDYLALYDPRDREKAINCFDKIKSGKSFASFDTEMSGNFGQQSLFSTHFTPVLEEGIVIGFLGVSVDITLKEAKDKVLNRYTNIESAIVKITQQLLESDELGSCLKEVGEAIQVDRITVFNFSDQNANIQNTYEWYNHYSYSIKEKLQSLDSNPFQWGLAELKKQKAIIINDVDFLPPDAKYIKKILKQFGIKSQVVIPLFVQDELIGLICFDDTQFPRNWYDFEIKLLQVLSDIIRLFFYRKSMSDKLADKEVQYKFMFDNSPIGICFVNLDGTLTKVNQPTAHILGYDSAEQLILEKKKIYDFLKPDYHQSSYNDAEILKHKDRNINREYVISDKNNVTKHIEINSTSCSFGNEIFAISFIRDITDKKQMEYELLENEKKYRTLVDTSPMGISMIDLDGIIIQCNKKMAEMLGYKSRQELLSARKSGSEFILPEYLEVDKKNLEILNETGNVYNSEYQIKSIKGSILSVELNASVLTNEKNEIIAYTGIFRDITLEKHIKNKLVESEKRYRSLAEAAQDIIFIIDKDDTITYVNNYAASQFGVSPEEMIGKKRSVYFEYETSKRQHTNLQAALKIGKPLYFEHKSDMPNKELWLGTRLVPLLDEHGEYYAILGLARNVTARKRMEAELIESKERYRLLVENQADLIVKVDKDGKFLFASPNYCETFDISANDLADSSFWPLVHPDDKMLTKEAMQKLFKPPYRCHIEQRALTRTGWRWFAWSDSAILDENGQVDKIIGVGRDITDQKKMEKELRASEERFRELAELLPEVVFEVDIKGDLTFINRYAYELTGYDIDDFRNGLNVLDLIVPEERSRAFKTIQEILNGSKNNRNEYHILRKDGSVFPIIARSNAIHHDGIVTGLRGIIMDISKQKLTEQALIDSEKQFRDSIERSIDGYFSINKNGEFVYLNSQAVNIIGYNVNELNTFIQNGILDDENFKDVVKTYNQVMGGKSKRWLEFQFADKAGKPFWIGLNARRVIESGIVKGVEGFIKDISKQKNSEIEIKNSEARYRTLFKNIPYQVFSLNDAGFFRDANIQFIETWGKVLKKRPADCISEPDFVQAINMALQKIKVSQKSETSEFRIGPEDDEIIYRLLLSPIITSEALVIGYLGLIIDITDQVETIELARRFSAQLVHFQEEEREQLAREIHDSLGQMLTALQFELGAANESIEGDNNQTRKMLTESRKTLNKVIGKARNLYSDLRPQLLDDFGIDVALADFGKEFQEKWGIQVKMNMMSVSTWLSKEAEISLYRITQEALNNVLKYAKAKQVFIELYKKNNHIVLVIDDDGMGFNINLYNKSSSSKHFGLIGMRERVDILSGEFEITSAPDKGTQITVKIPINSGN